MWNVAESGDVKCGGERLMWNVAGCFDVKSGGER